MNNLELKYQNTSLISDQQIAEQAIKLKDYVGFLNQVTQEGGYKYPESSINLPYDSDLLSQIKELVKNKKKPNLKYIIVIGIGGPGLGAKTVYEAIFGPLDYLLLNRLPKIIFLNTIHDTALIQLKQILTEQIKDPDEIIVTLISKSGTTMEPIINFEIVYNELHSSYPEIDRCLIVITEKGLKLWQLAQKTNLDILEIPQQVGGRYSIFSAFGLLPLALAGVDIESLINGAKAMHDRCLSSDWLQNPALISASLLYISWQKNWRTIDNFFFNPELESLGKWYRQLMAESLGKEFDLDGKQVNIGLMPTVSIGSSDLHSMVQLYLAGPKDKFTNFVYIPTNSSSIIVPQEVKFAGLVEHIANRSVNNLMSAIFNGVKIAYQKNNLPFAEIVLPDLYPYSLGQYLQFKMIEIMMLGKLFNINAFDQPKVEDYKRETKEILMNS